jgi:hypothetical protein
LTNPQKGIWSFTIPDMINLQKRIDLMNNTSIINRILFAVTLFQHVLEKSLPKMREGIVVVTMDNRS